MFCSRACHDAQRYAEEKEIRRSARAGNVCIACGAVIPDTRRGDTLFCGKSCSDRVSYERTKGRRRAEMRKGRLCAICGRPISEDLRAGTKYCCAACREEADRRMRIERRKKRKG